MELMTYKCPNCGGAIVFSSETQQFKCESCDSIFSEEQLSAHDATLEQEKNEQQSEQQSEQQIEQQSEQQSEQPNEQSEQQSEQQLSAEEPAQSSYDWQQMPGEQELEGAKAYSCEYCGAQIVTDSTTAASECPYCNNPIIMVEQLSGINRPDLVIPFKLDKTVAEAKLKDFYKHKPLLPKEFASANRVKKISGVYVPFWLYDCNVSASVSFTATKTRSWRDSKYNYIETSHYNVWRKGTLEFDKVPVDGSSKMDDAYMEAVEPFDYDALVDFNPAFLSGYLADKYDVDSHQSIPRANERIEISTAEMFKSTVVGYTTVTPQGANIQANNGVCRYALMPVWILNTKYGDKTFTFAMNGQTGKLVGELPVDKKKFWLYFSGIFAAVLAIAQFFIF